MPPATAAAPLALVIGADSLSIRRSGVGRMTLEIINATRHRPEVAGLRLLMAGNLHAADAILHRIATLPSDQEIEPADLVPTRPSLSLRIKRQFAGVPGVQRLRAAKRRLIQHADYRDLRRTGAGQIVYHEPNMIPAPFPGPTVVTVNDLSWHHHPEYHPQERLDWIARNLKRMLSDATRFVAISRFTANALTAEFGIDPARIDVVPLAAGPQFVPVDAAAAAPTLARYELTDRGYILSVSTLEPRKNFDRLMAAHLALPEPLRQRFPLVIVGGSGWGSTLASPATERARQSGTLRLLGHVNDTDLIALYARAALFAYVSVYEGFGLPVIEAMATGAAVLAAATTATGETAGAAAELVNPLDVDDIAAGLHRLLDDPAHTASLRKAGAAHAAAFTWQNTTTALISTWNKARLQP